MEEKENLRCYCQKTLLTKKNAKKGNSFSGKPRYKVEENLFVGTS